MYACFRVCSKLLEPGGRVLSVGAGGAYVERQLAAVRGADVTVLDFPEAVEAHRAEYARYGFDALGLDLADEWRLQGRRRFDLGVSFEVLEHLPISPRRHFESIGRHLRPGGHLVATTPNLARLTTILRLLGGRPIFPDADHTFQPTSYAAEHVHRREYVARELVAAMERAGFEHRKTRYLFERGRCPRGFVAAMAWMATALNPRFKNILLLVGRKRS